MSSPCGRRHIFEARLDHVVSSVRFDDRVVPFKVDTRAVPADGPSSPAFRAVSPARSSAGNSTRRAHVGRAFARARSPPTPTPCNPPVCMYSAVRSPTCHPRGAPENQLTPVFLCSFDISPAIPRRYPNGDRCAALCSTNGVIGEAVDVLVNGVCREFPRPGGEVPSKGPSTANVMARRNRTGSSPFRTLMSSVVRRPPRKWRSYAFSTPLS